MSETEPKHYCEICKLLGKPNVPAAVRESNGEYYCYEHHMDYNTCMTKEQMLAGKKRGGLF
jgi:hypothetical protein